MWIVKESGDKVVIKALPVPLWGGALLSFVLGAISISVYFLAYENSFARLFAGTIIDILARLGTMLFGVILGAGILAASPVIVTTIDNRQQKLTLEKIGLFGKRKREVGFDYLNGGVRVKSEGGEDANTYMPYIELKTGEKIKLCVVPLLRVNRSYDIAMKANEYLRTEEPQSSNLEND